MGLIQDKKELRKKRVKKSNAGGRKCEYNYNNINNFICQINVTYLFHNIIYI